MLVLRKMRKPAVFADRCSAIIQVGTDYAI
jgi:hypothetical protein